MENTKGNITDADLKALLRELASRRSGTRRCSFGIRAWKFTIFLAYAIKRATDLLVGSLAIALLSPVFALAALAVKLSSPGPVIFTQTRVGRYGRHFKFYKFRSMYAGAEARKSSLLEKNESGDGVIFKMRRDPRITPVGRFLRRSSIDELPQLWNVLKGDMSLVGPRPPTPDEVEKYTLEDRKRLDVIPGITGLWQVSGRSDLPFSEQVRLDKKYILESSPWKDFVILLKTIPAVLGGKGAY